MCIVSMVHDRFEPLIPKPEDFPKALPQVLQAFELHREVEALRAVIADFREAIEAAKKLDAILKQPDCIDPEKAKLEERVARLEKVIASMSAAAGG